MIHWALAYIEKDRFQEVEAERIAEGGESTPKMNTNFQIISWSGSSLLSLEAKDSHLIPHHFLRPSPKLPLEVNWLHGNRKNKA